MRLQRLGETRLLFRPMLQKFIVVQCQTILVTRDIGLEKTTKGKSTDFQTVTTARFISVESTVWEMEFAT